MNEMIKLQNAPAGARLSPAAPYRVERVNDEASLASLRDEWSATLAEMPDASIFLTWEWVSTWWRHHEANWELWVLTARDAGGRLAGIAPWLLYHHHYGPLRLARIAFPGSFYAYRIHMDVIARRNDQPAVCEAFLSYLREHQSAWDVLDLESLAENSAVAESLAHAPGVFGQHEPVVCRYVSLPTDWQTFEQEHLSANRRQQLRARRRKLERDHPGEVRFSRVGTRAELGRALDALVRLHRRRWHERQQKSSFDDPTFADFHREMAALALARGWLRFYLLEVGDCVIAAQYCLLYGGVLFDYQKSFDSTWDSYSPGQILQAHILQEAIGEGAREFDMGHQAVGPYDYKFSWTDQARVESHSVLSVRWPGHVWWYGGALLRGARRLARDVVPHNARQSLNRLLTRAQARSDPHDGLRDRGS